MITIERHYDVFVIGTGPSGSTVAVYQRNEGRSVGIAEAGPFGGTCALRGCNPKKVLSTAGETVDRTRHMAGKGIDGTPRINWRELIAFKRTFTESVPGATKKKFADKGIDAYHGSPRFTGKNSLRIGDDTVTADAIVIATGSEPRRLDIPGEEHVVTSEQFMELEELPARVLFIGGGYVSCEFSHVARMADSDVTIVEYADRLLGPFDGDLVSLYREAMEIRGIKIHTGTEVTGIEKPDGRFIVKTAGKETFSADMVVHGAGRVPALAALDPGKAGITTDPGIEIDEYLRSVDNPAVYVVGDANARSLPLTPVAEEEGKAVSKTLSGTPATVDYRGVPMVVFSTPVLAAAGYTEAAAREAGLDITVNFDDTSTWSTNRRLNMDRSGYKVIIDRKTGIIAGAHLLGSHAEDVINIFSLAIRARIPVDELRSMIWTFPTPSYDIGSMLK